MTATVPSRNSVWDNDPSGYDDLRQKQGWLNERRGLFIESFLKTCAKPMNILEIGSGTGQLAVRIAHALADAQWTGIDPLPSYVAFAQAKIKFANLEKRIRFSEAKAEQLAALSIEHPFNAVISNDVLHHIDDMQTALKAVSAVASEGALWCAIEPNALNPYAGLNQLRRKEERNFWPHHFLPMAKKAGWILVEKKYIFLIPPVIPNPSKGMKWLEQKLEGIPFLGGGVVLILRHTKNGAIDGT